MKRFPISLIALALTASMWAATPNTDEGGVEDPESEAVEMLHRELATPEVPNKQREFVRTHMKGVAQSLYRAGFEVETMREGEVVIAILPTDRLFAPNDTKLIPSAANRFDHFKQYFANEGRYKIVLAAHSDNTGSEEYLLDLTEARILAVIDYLESLGVNVDDVVGFPLADFDPLVENDTRDKRARNRRIEVYIVPGQQLIDAAKPKKK